MGLMFRRHVRIFSSREPDIARHVLAASVQYEYLPATQPARQWGSSAQGYLEVGVERELSLERLGRSGSGPIFLVLKPQAILWRELKRWKLGSVERGSGSWGRCGAASRCLVDVSTQGDG